MAQKYSCGNCGALVTYGQRFCTNCGMTLNWGTQQMPPTPYGYQYFNPQQAWWQQQTQYYQQQAWRNSNQYQQPNASDNRGAVPQQRRQSTEIIFLEVIVVILLVFGGIALMTNGDFFDALSGSQTTNVPPESNPEPQTPPPDIDSEPESSPVLISFIANPDSITEGETTMLSWDIDGATSVSIDQGVGEVALYGTREVIPDADTTYIITASNAVGSVTASVSVNVTPITAPLISSFTAIPGSILAGESAVLQWTITKADSVTIDQGIGTVSSSGTKTVSPVTDTTYILTATNSIGSETESVEVTVTGVVGNPPEINYFNASPDTVEVGGHSILNWNVSGATSLYISGIGNVPLTATHIVYPSESTTYTLTATNDSGSVEETTTVFVEE